MTTDDRPIRIKAMDISREGTRRAREVFRTLQPCPDCGSRKVELGLDDACDEGRFLCTDCNHLGPMGRSTWECARLWNEAAKPKQP